MSVVICSAKEDSGEQRLPRAEKYRLEWITGIHAPVLNCHYRLACVMAAPRSAIVLITGGGIFWHN